MKFLLSLFIFLGALNVSAEPIKIGHMGIVVHEQVLRLLTDDSVLSSSFPGAKGLIAFNALDSGKIDFLVANDSSIFISPSTSKDIISFEPIEKYRVVALLQKTKPIFMLAPQYKSIADLVDKKCVEGQILFASAYTEKSQLLIREALKPYNCKFEYVKYSTGQSAANIDVAAGRVDITMTSESTAHQFADRVTIVTLSSFDNQFIKHETIGSYLITRKDVSDETISKLLTILRSKLNSNDVIEWENSNKVSIPVEDANMSKVKKLRDFYKNILSKEPL